MPFSRELYIERDDFREDPPKKFFRLAPGREVRLRYAYFVTCTAFVKDATGEIVELRCTYDPATRGGDAPDGRKVKATIHWVSAAHALDAEVRLYDRLFTAEQPGRRTATTAHDLNPARSRSRHAQARAERRAARAGHALSSSSASATSASIPRARADRLVFNRTVTLRDTWAKIEAETRRPRARLNVASVNRQERRPDRSAPRAAPEPCTRSARPARAARQRG